MQYIFIEAYKCEEWPKEFATKEAAIEFGEREWGWLSEADKKRCVHCFVLKSANPDEDAPDHYDGEVVKKWK